MEGKECNLVSYGFFPFIFLPPLPPILLAVTQSYFESFLLIFFSSQFHSLFHSVSILFSCRDHVFSFLKPLFYNGTRIELKLNVKLDRRKIHTLHQHRERDTWTLNTLKNGKIHVHSRVLFNPPPSSHFLMCVWVWLYKCGWFYKCVSVCR